MFDEQKVGLGQKKRRRDSTSKRRELSSKLCYKIKLKNHLSDITKVELFAKRHNHNKLLFYTQQVIIYS